MPNNIEKVLGASYATSLGGIVAIICGTGLMAAAAFSPERWEILSVQGIGLIGVGISLMRARADNVTSERQARFPGVVASPPDITVTQTLKPTVEEVVEEKIEKIVEPQLDRIEKKVDEQK